MEPLAGLLIALCWGILSASFAVLLVGVGLRRQRDRLLAALRGWTVRP